MQFKRMADVYSRLVDNTITNTSYINDFSVGSATRAIYEAIAIEMETFYILTQENMNEAIANGIYSSFGFPPKPAIAAYGPVTINFNNTTQQDMILSRGSQFSCSNPSYTNTYTVTQDYTIPAGSLSADVTVYCTIAGVVGNIPVNTIDTMNSPLANVKSVTNAQAIQTGADAETPDAMRSRFQQFVKSLARGTIAAIEYGTRSVTNITGCYVDEQTGLITVYAHDANGNLDSSLQTSVVNTLANYKPGGIPVNVLPVDRLDTDVTAVVTLVDKSANTTAFNQQIVSVISNYLNAMTAGQDLVLSDLSSVIKYVDRTNIYDISFTTPSTNIDVLGSQLIRAGNVTVTLQ